jgi:hypothetical protein
MLLGAAVLLYLAPSSLPSGGSPRQEMRSATIARGNDGAPDTLQLRMPDEDSIGSGVAAAIRLSGSADAGDAAAFSRSCEEDLRSYPSPSLLDHCIAFDTASALLTRNLPDARFRPEAMATRHARAAMRVSNDPVLAEERIASVRRESERLLLQRMQR